MTMPMGASSSWMRRWPQLGSPLRSSARGWWFRGRRKVDRAGRAGRFSAWLRGLGANAAELPAGRRSVRDAGGRAGLPGEAGRASDKSMACSAGHRERCVTRRKETQLLPGETSRCPTAARAACCAIAKTDLVPVSTQFGGAKERGCCEVLSGPATRTPPGSVPDSYARHYNERLQRHGCDARIILLWYVDIIDVSEEQTHSLPRGLWRSDRRISRRMNCPGQPDNRRGSSCRTRATFE